MPKKLKKLCVYYLSYIMAEHPSIVSELQGKELYNFRNRRRSEFAAKARKAYLKQPLSKIPKVDYKKTYLRINTSNFKTLISFVINSIVISPTDPTSDVREYSQMTDEELSRTPVYAQLEKNIERTNISIKTQIQEWIAYGHLVRLFETYFDERDEENIDDLSQYNQLERNLLFYQRCKPISFKWMWVIYKDFRKQTRPREPMCDCCYHHDDEDDDTPKLTFAQYFRDSGYEFYTEYTVHNTYYYNIIDFMRLAYRAILDIQPAPVVETKPSPAPVVEMRQEPVCQVLLVSDEELLSKISELKAKYPEQSSVKSLCKYLKREKSKWQVTETRITKLLKKSAA